MATNLIEHAANIGRSHRDSGFQNLTPFTFQQIDTRINIQRWAEIVQIRGVHHIKSGDWSSCDKGWTLFQLEPEFYPDHDLLLSARIGRRPVPLILKSNGHALVPDYANLQSSGKLVKFSFIYSTSFGCRIGVRNHFGAYGTSFRYPSASRHGEIVTLSGVITNTHRKSTVLCNRESILIGKLPLTYWPEHDARFLCTGIDRLYLVTVTSKGDILLDQDSSLLVNHPVTFSLDRICYVAYNTLASLSLGLRCDYNKTELRVHSGIQVAQECLVSPFTVSTYCGLVFIGATVKLESANITSLTTGNIITLAVLPNGYSPESRIVRLIPVRLGKTIIVARLTVTPAGKINIDISRRDINPLTSVVIYLDFHYFLK